MKEKILAITLAGLATAAQADDPFAFDAEEEKTQDVIPVFDITLRQDYVRDLPRPVEVDFDRWMVRAHLGADWLINDRLSLRATGRVHASEQDNDKVAFNLDNTRLRDAAVDELYADWRGEHVGWRFGQSPLTVSLTPMVWDQDLRVRGLSLDFHADNLSHSNGLMLTGGEIDHAFGSAAELAAAQWTFRKFGNSGSVFEMRVGAVIFDELDSLPQGFRTNTRTGGMLANEFRLADLQLAYRFGSPSFPWRASLDLVRNLEAGEERDGGRVELRAGDAASQGGFEFGVAAQRIQQDAVPAALNDDDWWFPTRMRGQIAWLAWGFENGWRLRAAGFQERRDDLVDHNRRLLLEIGYRY